MKLPTVPPTNPPVYVGPLRTSSSSVNSTADTMNCTGCGQTGNGLAGPPTRAAARGRMSADLSVVSIVKAFAAGGCRVPGGPSQSPSGNHKRTLRRPRTGGPLDRYLRQPPRVRMTASATFRVLAKGDLDAHAALASAVGCAPPPRSLTPPRRPLSNQGVVLHEGAALPRLADSGSETAAGDVNVVVASLRFASLGWRERVRRVRGPLRAGANLLGADPRALAEVRGCRARVASIARAGRDRGGRSA